MPVADLLPAPFRPQLIGGWAVGGICLIRLGGIRPRGVPRVLGLRTENLAHRFAVEWDDEQGAHQGVFIPRRDTSSRITELAGGRLFPGDHQRARFVVSEPGPAVEILAVSADDSMRLSVLATETDDLGSALFAGTGEAIEFFWLGSHGYSPSRLTGCLDGVRLEADSWAARPMNVQRLESSFFGDQSLFPAGSCVLDSALVMRNLRGAWIADPPSTNSIGVAPMLIDKHRCPTDVVAAQCR
jgi:hypothetical protein